MQSRRSLIASAIACYAAAFVAKIIPVNPVPKTFGELQPGLNAIFTRANGNKIIVPVIYGKAFIQVSDPNEDIMVEYVYHTSSNKVWKLGSKHVDA